jgi:hypothetical protein
MNPVRMTVPLNDKRLIQHNDWLEISVRRLTMDLAKVY